MRYAEPRAPRSSPVCSRLRYLDHRRTEQAIAEHVAARELFDDFAFTMIGTGLMDHRLVVARIEVDTHRVDWCYAPLAKQFEHLLMNEFNALAEAFDVFARRRFQCAFEIIDDWQQAGQCACRRGFRLIASIPLDTLAI